jgi:uncharacterized RDD family membrane protein YckC
MGLASLGTRFSAFLMDMIIICLSILAVYLIMLSSDFSFEVTMSISGLLSFTVFNLYFIFFELAWRGRTPGKSLVGLIVVNRHGGELTPTAIVARNLTRILELYIPIFMMASIVNDIFSESYTILFTFWLVLGLLFPTFNRDQLRLGDLIGGTLVIIKPSQVLAQDLSQPDEDTNDDFIFSSEQLTIYGYFELKVLEDMLRRADALPMPKGTPIAGLDLVARKIITRLDYRTPVPPGAERRFLTVFYTAQRAVLERALLFGQQKWNQYLDPISVSAVAAGFLPPPAAGPWPRPPWPGQTPPAGGNPGQFY